MTVRNTSDAEQEAAFAASVLSALGAFESGQKLTATIQVRVTPDTAKKLDDLRSELKKSIGIDLNRSDLVRTAITALIDGTRTDPEALAKSA